MARLIGKVKIYVNGRILRSNDGASIDLGGDEREMQTGSGTVHGFTEKTKPSEIEATINVATGDDLEALRTMTDGTAEFTADTGHKWLVSGATVLNTLKVTGDKGGQVPVKIGGQPAVQV